MAMLRPAARAAATSGRRCCTLRLEVLRAAARAASMTGRCESATGGAGMTGRRCCESATTDLPCCDPRPEVLGLPASHAATRDRRCCDNQPALLRPENGSAATTGRCKGRAAAPTEEDWAAGHGGRGFRRTSDMVAAAGLQGRSFCCWRWSAAAARQQQATRQYILRPRRQHQQSSSITPASMRRRSMHAGQRRQH